MADQPQLRPSDLPVALSLIGNPEQTFAGISETLGISLSTAHAAIGRLRQSGLVYVDRRAVNRTALLEFIEHGVRYAFPPQLGGIQRGVATGYSGPDLAKEFVFAEAVVWPDANGDTNGVALTPLFPQATTLPNRNHDLYANLALVDAVRMGRARERKVAMERLRDRFWNLPVTAEG